jgi:GT2 family glycosyltransferase
MATLSDLTFAVLTCGRPDKIKLCLESIYKYHGPMPNVIVLDSYLTSETNHIYSQHPGIKVVGLSSPISPSEARYQLASRSETTYTLFLDDDLVLTETSVPVLYQRLVQHPHISVVSAAWREKKGFRELAQLFHLAEIERQKVIFKSFLYRKECERLSLSAVRVDGLHASMMVRTSIFEEVNFDPRFGFYLELFDFFMQCKRNGLVCEALTDTYFWHRPSEYRLSTKRATVPRTQGILLFQSKWGLTPVGSLGYTPTSASLKQILSNLYSSIASKC